MALFICPCSCTYFVTNCSLSKELLLLIDGPGDQQGVPSKGQRTMATEEAESSTSSMY